MLASSSYISRSGYRSLGISQINLFRINTFAYKLLNLRGGDDSLVTILVSAQFSTREPGIDSYRLDPEHGRNLLGGVRGLTVIPRVIHRAIVPKYVDAVWIKAMEVARTIFGKIGY